MIWLTVLSTLAVYKNLKTTVVQTWSVGLAWQHQSCPPWTGCGATRSFSWALRFACTRPLWCPFCYMLQKPGHYFRVTKKRWRHLTWSANAKSCTDTGFSMSQTQKYPLVQAYHLLWTSSEDVVCQRPTLPSWASIGSGRSLGRNWRGRPGRLRVRWTDQLRNDTGSVPANLSRPWWSDATARTGYALTMTTAIWFVLSGNGLSVLSI